MKKITGKVVSLVLALALVVTSFSGTFAFASSKTVSGNADFDNDEIYLVNGGTTDDQKKVSDLDSWLVSSLQTSDHTDAGSIEISAISHSSGDTLVKWNIKDGKADITLKGTDKSGKEVLSVLVKGTYNDNDGNEITVKGRKNLTVHVLDKDDYIITKTQTKAAGKGLDELDTFAQTAGSAQKISVYQALPDVASAKATYVALNVALDKALYAANDVLLESTNTSDVHLAPTSTATEVTATIGKQDSKTSKLTNNASVGSFNISSKKVKLDANKIPTGFSDKSADKTTFKAKIEKKVDTSVLTPSTNYTIAKDGGTTVLKGIKNPLITGNATASAADTVVTGAEVVFNTTGTVTINDKTNVKKISGTVGLLDINDATVGSVDLDAGAVNVADGRVGDIATKTNLVTVSSGKTGNIVVKDSGVVINGGTVGTIETKDDKASAGDVTVKSNDDDTAIVTGKITAPSVEVNSDESKITVAGIKASKADGTIRFIGKDISVKDIDLDYRNTSLTFGSTDNEFVGTVAAATNGKNAKFITENEDTDVTVTGVALFDTISLASKSNVTFKDKVTVDTIDGDGVLSIAANKLYISGSASAATLRLTDAVLANGMTVLTAKSDAVGEEDLTTFGYTLSKSTGNSIDTFKISSLKFAGLQVNKTSARIAKNYSETFTASAYPGGTTLPTDTQIKWVMSGSEDVFQVTTSGNNATVKVLKTDSDFASENTATLTAQLVDKDGDEVEDYGSAKVALTAIAVPDAKSDTTKDFSVAAGASYQFKITSTTAPVVTYGTSGVFAGVLASHTGNDYFYKITATGKVGAATGIYLNGTKLLVASVKAPAFTSDTKGDVTVKGSYQVKITATTTPSFGVGTAGVVKAAFVSKNGNDYLYKVTSTGKVGAKTGVYVNGVKTFVAIVG